MTLGLGNAFFLLTYCLDSLTGRYAERLALGGLGIRSMLETIVPIVAWLSMGAFAINAIRNYNGWGY